MFEASSMQGTDLLGHPIQATPPKKTTKKSAAPKQTRDIVVITEPALLGPTNLKGPHFEYHLPENERYLGNLVEIYDAVPRFSEIRSVNEDQMVRTASGIVRGIRYQVTVTAAVLQVQLKVPGNDAKLTKPKNLFLLPGIREEFVEKAIRKISTYKSEINGNRCVVDFTLYELKKELAKFGHDYKYKEIREALHILTHARIQIVTTEQDGSTIDITSGYLNNLEIRSPSKRSKFYDPKAGPDQGRCKVELHPLLSLKISQGQFRLYQYGIDMSLNSVFSRHLLRHLSFTWANASEDKPFKLSLMDFITNVLARVPDKRLYNDFRKLDEAVNELIKSGMLTSNPLVTKVKATRGNGFSDYIFEFCPTNRFVSSVIESSSGVARRRIARQKALI